MNTNTVHTDVPVIGSGLAGLSAAWQAAQRVCVVALLTHAKDIHDSNTNLAQGGIIYRGREESPEQLVEDVLAACRVELASGGDALGRRGPRLVKDVLIDELGVPFDRVRAGRCTPMHSA